MSNQPNTLADQSAIKKTLQHYIDGARSGRSEIMHPAFHDAATVFGYIGQDLFAGPIKQLYDWNDSNGPAINLTAKFARIDVTDSVATAQLELDDWTGHRFTDLFTLLKVDGEWKIMNKVFHLHH